MSYMQDREEREKASAAVAEEAASYELPRDVSAAIKKLRKKMQAAADNMDFEEAARYRDRMRALEQMQVEQAF
jgi:excinuclease ABC subunit B